MAVSVIIPCKNEAADISGLMEDLAKQKAAFQTEIIKITGVSPVSLARNQGAEKAKGEVLIFIDCDIRLGNEFFLANLVGVLEKNEKIGAVCASILIPPGSSRFQRRYAKEVPHAQSPQVEAIMDVSVASSACCAIEKEKFL
ncbi:MAG: glycosyltransferase, partial [Candidatus Omnitrophica bacterium]|nr:glycosyltransferase [Candidatus Omnitrophota bacterium]MBU1925361.1 glycosyltransferase [Candidatus Omnitrophota bacterium]